MPFTGTTAAEALAYINANPTISTQELVSITEKMSATVNSAKVKLAYSGTVRSPNGAIEAYKIANAVQAKYGSDVATISNSEVGKLLEDPVFKTRLENSFSGTPTEKTIQYATLMNGSTIDGTRINNTSLWDKASSKYVGSGTQPIINIVDDYKPTSVWSQTEIKAVLKTSVFKSANRYVDGVKVQDLQAAYQSLKSKIGEPAAYEAIAQHMNVNSITNISDNISYVFDAETKQITDISIKRNLFKKTAKNTNRVKNLIYDFAFRFVRIAFFSICFFLLLLIWNHKF